MVNYYCGICDKTINRKSKTKHIKTKNHSFLDSYVRKKHNFDDVYWEDFEKFLEHYVVGNSMKFPIFRTTIKFKTYDKDIKFQSKRMNFVSFDSNVNFYYISCLIKRIRNYIRHYVAKMGKELSPESNINNLAIMFDSYYYIMHPKYRLQQPRRILESKLLKHITKLVGFEKESEYGFLSHIYKLVHHDDDDVTIYVDNNQQ